MATGDVSFGYGSFAPGETVTLTARDVTPGMPNLALGKSGVAAANGGLTIAAVPATATMHGTTQRVYAVGTGGTSGRAIGAIPAP